MNIPNHKVFCPSCGGRAEVIEVEDKVYLPEVHGTDPGDPNRYELWTLECRSGKKCKAVVSQVEVAIRRKS